MAQDHNDIYSIVERLRILEEGLDKNQKSVNQLSATFKPKTVAVLTAKKDPKNPMAGKLVGGCEESEENPLGPKELEYLIAKAKQSHHQPDPALHKGDEHEINGDNQKVGEGIAGNMTSRSNPLTQPLRTVRGTPDSPGLAQCPAGRWSPLAPARPCCAPPERATG